MLVNRLMKNNTWTNKDIGLLVLSVNGIIPLSISSTDQEGPNSDIEEQDEASGKE